MQPQRYKDTLKASLREFNIPLKSKEQAAQDRWKWHGIINKDTALYEEKRICKAERKHREHKARANDEPSPVSKLISYTCNRQLIGL